MTTTLPEAPTTTTGADPAPRDHQPAPGPDSPSHTAASLRWSGTVAAAFLATGLGSAAFGIAVVAAQANETVKTALTLQPDVGPLSGKAIVGTLAYLASWAGLHLALRRRTVAARTTCRLTTVTLGIGVALTFPPLYQAFA